MEKYAPIFDEIPEIGVNHLWIHTSLKIEKDQSLLEYSKLTNKVIKTVSHFILTAKNRSYLLNDF